MFAGSLFLIGLLVPDAYDGLTLIDEKAQIAEKDLQEFEADKSQADSDNSPELADA